jgi:hypothetical protein
MATRISIRFKDRKLGMKKLAIRNVAVVGDPRKTRRAAAVRLSQEPGPVVSGLIVPIDRGARQRHEDRVGRASKAARDSTGQPNRVTTEDSRPFAH